LPPFVCPLYSHHYITKCTHSFAFYISTAPQLHSSLPCSLSLHFRFFCTIYGYPPATNTSPHLYPLYWIVSLYSPSPSWPIPFPCSCQLTLPSFSLFVTIYGCSLATSTSPPHHLTLPFIIFPSPTHSLNGWKRLHCHQVRSGTEKAYLMIWRQ
jgi:hypothetical protein